jgi:hypothetical protein
MRRTVSLAVIGVLASGLVLIGGAAPAAAEPDTKFSSCRAMRAVDPNGVALTQRAVKRAVKQGFRKPLLCPIAYDANKRLDRDGDGVACERRRR